jgi:undecaprenyl-diphosphatase
VALDPPTVDPVAQPPKRGPVAQAAQEFDERVYTALAAPLGPGADRWVGRFTTLADHSKISMLIATGLAGFGGSRGRRAAVTGMVAVAATSATANAIVKPVAHRRRPVRHPQHPSGQPGMSHHVSMPTSRSFPSGHTAAASAFATAVGSVWPRVGAATALIAVAVGYSRVHVGVHYPGDVAAGALLGVGIGALVGRYLPGHLPVGLATVGAA